MNIDLTDLITNIKEEILLNIDLSFDKELFNNTNIKKLINTTFNGEIIKLYNNEFQISGYIEGTMILPDDITLEDTEYKFKIYVEEKINDNNDNNLKIIHNKLDISEFLWQNIQVEIPMKVKNSKNDNITLKGDGWRLTTEEELNLNNNTPFAELQERFEEERSDD